MRAANFKAWRAAAARVAARFCGNVSRGAAANCTAANRAAAPWAAATWAIATVALLGGCGFRLAGSGALPGILARPYLSVKDPYTDFAREFEHQLKGAGALVQEVRPGSTATIEITRDTVEQRTLSVSARNIPTEYELTYTVTFAVHGPDAELLAPQTLNLSQDYSFVESELLAKQHEADMLRAQMARDLVSIAMRRLTRLK